MCDQPQLLPRLFRCLTLFEFTEAQTLKPQGALRFPLPGLQYHGSSSIASMFSQQLSGPAGPYPRHTQANAHKVPQADLNGLPGVNNSGHGTAQ